MHRAPSTVARMTMKRRVIYVGDLEWTLWRDAAQTAGKSVSELIRLGMMLADNEFDLVTQPTEASPKIRLSSFIQATPTSQVGPRSKAGQAQRDAILRRINKGGRER